MRAVLQRVSAAEVSVGGRGVAQIGRGLLVLFCAEAGDRAEEAGLFARKIARMRIFEDEDGRMNRSLLDVGGEALVVSQFTLAAAWRRGNRPSFSKAAPADEGRALFAFFCRDLADQGLPVHQGVYGARMAVSLVNDGPVTILMSSADD